MRRPTARNNALPTLGRAAFLAALILAYPAPDYAATLVNADDISPVRRRRQS